MRVLLTPLGEIGHVNPLVGVCQRLVASGHEVAFHSHRHYAAQLARAGVTARWFGEQPDAGAPPQELAARMRDPRWLERWYARVAARTALVVESLTETVQAFRPDVMSVDPLNVMAATVAEREGIPWVAVSTNFVSLRPEGWTCPFIGVGAKVLAGKLPPLFAEYGVKVQLDSTEAVSPWFNSVFTTERFVPRPPDNRHSTYVGPARADGARGDEPAFPWERLGDRPLMYVSSGGGQSLGFDAALLLRLARAIDPGAVDLVIAAPTLHADEAFRAALPASVIVVPYAPQRALLARARVAVTHGGVSSVNECLEAGCAMLVLALGKEQPLQAELVAKAGAGLALDVLTMSDDDCRGALSTLLAGTGSQEAAAIRDDYRATDSSGALFEALTAVARRERPTADR